MHRCSWSIGPLGASVRWTPDRTIARRASPRGSGVPFSVQSFTATKHTGSEGTRDMLSKNKKRTRNIKKYERVSNSRPRAFELLFVPLDYNTLDL